MLSHILPEGFPCLYQCFIQLLCTGRFLSLFFPESCGLTRREKQIFFLNEEKIILKKGEHYKEWNGRDYCR